MSLFCAGLLAAGLMAACGCGGDSYSLAPVSGVVKLDGKLLPNAHLTFQPRSDKGNPGPGSIGMTDANGRYTLKTIDDREGAVVGKHTVSITTNPYREAPSGDKDAAPSKELIPARYNFNTELTCDVPAGGRDDANFDLKSR